MVRRPSPSSASAEVSSRSLDEVRCGLVAVEQSTERGGGFGQLCAPKRTGSSRPDCAARAKSVFRPFGRKAVGLQTTPSGRSAVGITRQIFTNRRLKVITY